MTPITNEGAIAATRRWLEKSVIGLGLCPFAEHVYKTDRVRFYVSEQRTAAALLEELHAEMMHLCAATAAQCETTLLIHPWALTDFIEYNDFLGVCEASVCELGLEGTLQVASFHPQYQFAGTRPEDIENFTNRSPYPTLHLLREGSIERALSTVADPDAIYRNNIRTLRGLGFDGWHALWRD